MQRGPREPTRQTGRKSSGIGLNSRGLHDLFVAHARHRIGFLVHIDANVDNPATIGEALVCHGEFLIKALRVSVLERIFSFFPSLSAIPRELIQHSDFQLLGGFFACQPLGTPLLKGFAQPLAVYRVLYESMARSRLEAVGSTGWTPLVGREQEIRLLRERWAQVKEGGGQVVLLSGEAGIGKSRLVQVLQEHVASEPQAWLTPCQCSPYHQNSALYPVIDVLERVVLQFVRDETPQQKLRKLEGFLVQHGLPLAEAVPLLATLLSLALPAEYAPLTMAPEQQKLQTLHA